MLVRIHPFNVKRILCYVNDSLEKKNIGARSPGRGDWFALVVAMPEVRHKGKPGAKGGTRAASAAGTPSGPALDAAAPMAAFEPPRPATEAPEDGRAIISRRQAGLVRYDGKRPKVRAPTAALPCSVVSRASGIAAQGQRQRQQLGSAGGWRPRPAHCRRVRQRRVGRAALWSSCLLCRLAPARCASVGASVG